jgi:adenylate cyclase
MWLLTIRSPRGEPTEHTIEPGKITVGRSSENNIVVSDASASRVHAELQFHPAVNALILRDLDSTNGTFTNRERITGPYMLQSGDTFRIGEHIFTVQYRDPNPPVQAASTHVGTRPLTRDLLLESLDHHAVLLYKIAQQLNTILDVDSALEEVARLIRASLGADRCEVILADRFDRLAEMGFPTKIAQMVIEQRHAVVIPDMPSDAEQRYGKSSVLLGLRSVLCVPVMSGEELLGLIYMFKTAPDGRRLDDNDLRLAVAISHQAALTIQRTQLIKRVQREREVRLLLQRFLSPPEAEYLLKDYVRTGHLPGLTEQKLTVLVADLENSTGLAERMGARLFGELLARYYHEMTSIIFRNGGMLDKYLGDGLMAVFGMTQAQLEPEVSAVRAGLEMLDKLDDINRSHSDRIEIGVGVNTGMVMAGYVGTDERVEFTVLGDAVNVAFRLEALARPNRLVIGPGTTGAITGRFNLQRVGAVDLKGRQQPVQAHEVLRGPVRQAQPDAGDDVQAIT